MLDFLFKMKEQLRLILGSCIILSILVILFTFIKRDEPETPEIASLPPRVEPEIKEPSLSLNPQDLLLTDAPDYTAPNSKVAYPPAIETSMRFPSANNSANITPMQRMGIVSELLTHYSEACSQSPSGKSNKDIVEQLLGSNPMNFVFISPNSPALKNGFLIDDWGTPYSFYHVQDQKIDIFSAGPDKKRWTNDDISSSKDSSLW